MRPRLRSVVTLAAFIVAAAVCVPALAETLSTASIETEPQGTIMQAGKAVAWASGAALNEDGTIRFEKSQAYSFQQSQRF